MADTLDRLARLRRLDEAEARRAVGQAVTRAQASGKAVEDALARRQTEASQAGTDDGSGATAFATWLPLSIRQVEAACKDRDASEAEARAAQAALASRKTALEAVETLIEERGRTRRRLAARRAQSRLDELGQRARRTTP